MGLRDRVWRRRAGVAVVVGPRLRGRSVGAWRQGHSGPVVACLALMTPATALATKTVAAVKLG
jgi:hypothetical protein